MGISKIAVTMEPELLHRLDDYVNNKMTFPNRSKIIQQAVKEKLERFEHSLLTKECKNLNKNQEQEFAEFGMDEEAGLWPTY